MNIKAQKEPNTIIGGWLLYPTIPNIYVIQIKKKINKETVELNDSIDKMNSPDIYRIFYPRASKYTFFSASHIFIQNTSYLRILSMS
jgi:transcription initiation factor IIE alpha subunit